MAYWLFQSNPKYYRIMDGIRDFEQMLWSVMRYAKDMVSGDGVRDLRIIEFYRGKFM